MLLSSAAPLGYATVKQSIQRALESSMEAEWQANLPNQALLLGSEDHREGLAAVTEKRAPLFRGR
jgi:enoyl-CoA hydratase